MPYYSKYLTDFRLAVTSTLIEEDVWKDEDESRNCCGGVCVVVARASNEGSRRFYNYEESPAPGPSPG